MLIEFSVENFRSISEKISINMVPAKGFSKPYNLIEIKNNPNIKKILKSSVIFGANGSGKTNLILALSVMRDFVIFSKNKNKGDIFKCYKPFILDNDHSQKPTMFEVHFLHDSVEYRYAFAYNLEKIVSEELSYYSGKKEMYMFKRNFNTIEPFIDHTELNNLFQSTGDNVLFLSKANNEYKKFGSVFEWFNKSLIAIGPLSRISDKRTINYMNKSHENKKRIIDFMHFADFDIYGIVGQNKKMDNPEVLENLKKIILALGTQNEKIHSDEKIEIESSEIKSVRKKIDGTEIIQDFSEFESDGTQQFFKIAGLWLESLQEKGRILVIDEFDIQLHPDLQQFLIKIFHDPEINQTGSQLIFTTHNTRLLSTNFFRREQICFVEKNPKTKSTNAYSLYDYEKRQDKSIEKGYYLGRYGGLPDIKYGMF
jgi:hypothetical protein